MAMTVDEARAYVAQNHRGALTTQMANGRPQLSLVVYAVEPTTGQIQMSVTKPRVKTKNVRRDSRVSLLVLGENFYQYVVAEGRASLIEDNPVPALRRVYEAVQGKPHPDWAEFDAVMVRDERVVLCIDVDRYYPVAPAG